MDSRRILVRPKDANGQKQNGSGVSAIAIEEEGVNGTSYRRGCPHHSIPLDDDEICPLCAETNRKNNDLLIVGHDADGAELFSHECPFHEIELNEQGFCPRCIEDLSQIVLPIMADNDTKCLIKNILILGRIPRLTRMKILEKLKRSRLGEHDFTLAGIYKIVNAIN